MIIEALMNVIYTVLDTLMVFELPSLPEEVFGFMADATSYLTSGVGILANYVHFPYLVVLFGTIALYDALLLGWRAIMWILRKIPFLGIE